MEVPYSDFPMGLIDVNAVGEEVDVVRRKARMVQVQKLVVAPLIRH